MRISSVVPIAALAMASRLSACSSPTSPGPKCAAINAKCENASDAL